MMKAVLIITGFVVFIGFVLLVLLACIMSGFNRELYSDDYLQDLYENGLRGKDRGDDQNL